MTNPISPTNLVTKVYLCASVLVCIYVVVFVYERERERTPN